MAMRLDMFVSEKYAFTRNKSQSFIKDGLISINGKIVIKPSFEIIGGEIIDLREDKKTHWVSRSAGKLDGFIDSLLRHSEGSETKGRIQNPEKETLDPSYTQDDRNIEIIGTYCLDVGSSTGGFTQILLERGAAHIDAVDVGTDQLHENLRNDPRVTSYEQMDIRNFVNRKVGLIDESVQPPDDLQLAIYDLIVCDASFISLTEILPSILQLADRETSIIILWKPQFEVGREHLRKTGVPKDEKIVEKRQKEWEDFVRSHNCEISHKEKSSVVGEAGNQEWLYSVKKSK